MKIHTDSFVLALYVKSFALLYIFLNSSLVLAQLGNTTVVLKPCKDDLCQSALKSLRSASVVVTGNLENDYYITGTNWNNGWIDAIKESSDYKDKYAEGLKFIDAVNWLKQRISKDAKDRQMTIDNAFEEVYGKKSTPLQQASWDAEVKAQKAWYAIIVSSEISKLNKDNSLRTETIHKVYSDVFGRKATQDELQYWLPRKEHYRTLLQANRTWLYSPQGAKDLVETVTRALTKATGSAPSETEIKNSMLSFTDKKLIYNEMVRQLEAGKK